MSSGREPIASPPGSATSACRQRPIKGPRTQTDARNLRVRGALLGVGASFEGIFRKHMVLPDSIRDSAWYAIVDDDWPRVKEMLQAKVERHAVT